MLAAQEIALQSDSQSQASDCDWYGCLFFAVVAANIVLLVKLALTEEKPVQSLQSTTSSSRVFQNGGKF